MTLIEFEKVQGTGNHFILFDRPWSEEFSRDVIRRLCDRSFGIGSDGILFVDPSEKAVAAMRMFNPDGSAAEMCGNGIRCFVEHLLRTEKASGDSVMVESSIGLHACKIYKDEEGEFDSVEVELGAAVFGRDMPDAPENTPNGLWGFDLDRPSQTPMIGYGVSVGNPHLVIFGPSTVERLLRHGPALEYHPLFPNRTNVELVEIERDGSLTVNVWERGAGRTLACGTGACAAAAAAVKLGYVEAGKPIPLDLPGGQLHVTVSEDFKSIRLKGPARFIFSGKIEIPELNP